MTTASYDPIRGAGPQMRAIFALITREPGRPGLHYARQYITTRGHRSLRYAYAALGRLALLRAGPADPVTGLPRFAVRTERGARGAWLWYPVADAI